MTTKTEFLSTYREVLKDTVPWAKDTAKLDRYMSAVEGTITPQDGKPHNMWLCDGQALRAAWRKLGRTGSPTLKTLRALMPCLLVGFVLLHQVNSETVTTLGYFSTERRCEHVANSVQQHARNGTAWCEPDDAELRDQGL